MSDQIQATNIAVAHPKSEKVNLMNMTRPQMREFDLTLKSLVITRVPVLL